MLALPGSSTISTASDANIICITFTKISSLPASLPSTFTRFMADDLNGMEERRRSSSRVLFFLFFPSGPERRKRGANGGELIFQNGAYLFVLFSTHACPPFPFPRFPTFISITPAIMTWRRGQSERQHFDTFLPRLEKKKKNRCTGSCGSILSDVHWDSVFLSQSAASLNLFKNGIASRSLGSDDERLA